MAGQLPGKLKVTDAASPAVRHEARLGILVITILVFAFGFLVYHKMDLHQRSLTQASIPSTAEAMQSPQSIKATTELERQSPPSVANDPLLNLADLSDESPFSAGEMTAATEFVTTESVTNENESVTTEFSFDEPSGLSDATVAVVDTAQPKRVPGDAEIPAFFNEPSIEVPATNEPATDVASIDVASIDVGSIDVGSIDVGSDNANRNASSAETTQSVGKGAAVVDGSLSASGKASVAESAAFDIPSFSDLPTSTSPTESTVESNDFADSASPASEDRGEEPMLFAMLEPQQDNGFSGGFTVEERNVSIGQAPVTEPVDAFPAFNATDATDAAEPRTQEPIQSISEKSRSFGIQGHNAVTQPGSRTGKNSIRTAAGSGSDGKFSLAAFNYQNNTAEPAPDDGSTFDSVVVQDGDNYTTISKRVYGTVRYFSALAVFNQHRIREPKSMRPGMVVLTPPKDVLEKRYPQLFVDSQPKIVEPAEFLILSDGSPAYRVGERETLSEISSRFLGRSSRWIEIYRLNQTIVKDPNKLKAGLILALPADAAEVSVVP